MTTRRRFTADFKSRVALEGDRPVWVLWLSERFAF